MAHRITLRPIGPEDDQFLAVLYASTREHELGQVPWSTQDKASFLRMQFDARHRHYATHYPRARSDLVLADGTPIGRLIVDRSPGEIRVIDVALVSAWRNRGIGGGLLRDLIAESDSSGRPITISVERFNPARRLYERLGFEVIADDPVYQSMERRPIASNSLLVTSCGHGGAGSSAGGRVRGESC